MGGEDDGKRALFSQVKETAAAASSLLRSALKGSLATLQRGSGHPYASLVLTATDSDGAPLFLISRLALSIFLAPVLYALVARPNDVLKV